ncbi:MAG: fumarate hydratase [Bacillota bacterium]
MREIKANKITKVIKNMAMEANFHLNEDIFNKFKEAKNNEDKDLAKNIFEQLIENAKTASKNEMPICQDTGFAVVFLEIGNEVIINGDLNEAINKGVSQGYKEGYLRKSIVSDPIIRNNTGDNTPAVIHSKIVKGDKLKIIFAPKGGGSENMSKIKMLKPADGVDGIKKFVINTVKEAGANPCPPVIVGIGIGGTFEKVAYLAKKSLLRPLNDSHPEKHIAKLEDELLTEINKLNIGPQGFGGRNTALGVKIEKFPCHIASLPVAVNLNCHAARHKEKII